MATQIDNINMLLIGKTGNGKSATGNSILGRKFFHSDARATSVKKIHCEHAEFSGRIIKVVDGPGVHDMGRSYDTWQQVRAANPEGYHAYLVVVRYGGRFTKEDLQTIQQLKGVFGEEFVKQYCILLVTCGDIFDSEGTNSRDFSDWCNRQTGVFRQLVDECGGRVILFDNRSKDAQKINEQRESLIKMIDSMRVLGLRYTDENFKRALCKRDRIMMGVPRASDQEGDTLRIQHHPATPGRDLVRPPELQLEKAARIAKAS